MDRYPTTYDCTPRVKAPYAQQFHVGKILELCCWTKGESHGEGRDYTETGGGVTLRAFHVLTRGAQGVEGGRRGVP